MSKKIILKALKDAPEAIGAGNFFAEKKRGKFITESREFADYLIVQGFAEQENLTPVTPEISGQQKTEGATN